MTYTIGLPIQGQPISSGNYGIKVRDAINDLDTRVALIEAAQSLPLSVRNTGNTNTVTGTANTWTNLPTNPWPTTQMTNPSADFDLYCLVNFGCWLTNTTGSLRMGVLLTGGISAGPDPGVNSVAGWGMMPLESTAGLQSQHAGAFSIVIPAGAAAVTFTAQSQRSVASGTQSVNYPTIEVTPIRFQPS
jgi:hypothetical protein